MLLGVSVCFLSLATVSLCKNCYLLSLSRNLSVSPIWECCQAPLFLYVFRVL
ncbi:hypothetical protein AMTRI_Chr10g1410 [Amborella trichopoda]